MSTVKASYTAPSGQRLEIAEGDLTQEPVDAIVNAANSYLAHGGGVAGAIVRRGGEQIQRESDEWVREHGQVTHEQPAYTGAGRLPCRYVIHAVGPIWGEGDEERKLGAAVRGSLELADRLGLSSIAFPAISTGIFGFPIARAVPVFLDTIAAYFAGQAQASLKLVRITLIDREALDQFRNAVERLAPPTPPA